MRRKRLLERGEKSQGKGWGLGEGDGRKVRWEEEDVRRRFRMRKIRVRRWGFGEVGGGGQERYNRKGGGS